MTSKTAKKPVKKLTIKKISESDKKIPRGLIIKYGESHYILKAGLEWKANDLFGGAGYSLMIEPVTMDYDQGRFVFKATLVVLENQAVYINFGEATSKNVNKMMLNQLLHLAVTRAECRVLRMATACGYASYDEVRTIADNGKAPITIENGDKPATKEQIATIKALDPGKSYLKMMRSSAHIESVDYKKMTKQDASKIISGLSEKK